MKNLVTTLYDEATTKGNDCAICGKQVHDLAFKAHIDCAANWVAEQYRNQKKGRVKSTPTTKSRI